MLADMMQTPIAVLRQVPQQPIFDGRKEDQIIALTFSKFFDTGETDWPLLLPMVKSAVRGDGRGSGILPRKNGSYQSSTSRSPVLPSAVGPRGLRLPPIRASTHLLRW